MKGEEDMMQEKGMVRRWQEERGIEGDDRKDSSGIGEGEKERRRGN